jgi:hypothetical protein
VTAEEIAQQYPTVPLVDVYSVITYYLRHKPEVDAYLNEREVLADRVGLELRDGTGAISDPSGRGVRIRFGVAKTQVIGEIRFRDVSFAVIPGPPPESESTPPSPPGGIAGVPVLLRLGVMHWRRTTAGLRPAVLTFQRNPALGGDCCVANIGRNLVVQRREFTIDFTRMTLRLD